MSNGCGCERGIFARIKPPYARLFDIPCRMHDDDYDLGGGAAERRRADRLLFRRMILTAARQEEASPLRLSWLFSVAWLYYLPVRLFGRFYFKGNNN